MAIRPLQIVESRPQLSDFELFYECYPRKKSRGDAEKAWKQTEHIRPAIEEILAAIERNMADGTWRESEKNYIPYPASWLRDHGWADE